MASEITWQRIMLLSLSNDIEGLYPLGHSLKWAGLDGLTSLPLTEDRWETPPNHPPSVTNHSSSTHSIPLPTHTQTARTTKGKPR